MRQDVKGTKGSQTTIRRIDSKEQDTQSRLLLAAKKIPTIIHRVNQGQQLTNLPDRRTKENNRRKAT